MKRLTAVLAVLVSLFGCASVSQQTATVSFEGGGKLNLTEVDWGVSGHGGAVVKHYVVEVLDRDGKQRKAEVYDKTAQVGTAQQAVTNLAGALPGMLGHIGAAALQAGAIKSAEGKRSDAIRFAAEVAADAAVRQSELHLEGVVHAVDNQRPTVVDNSQTHFNLSASAEGGQAVALQQQDQNQGQQQSQVSAPVSQAFAGTETNVDIGIGVNQPCTENCGF